MFLFVSAYNKKILFEHLYVVEGRSYADVLKTPSPVRLPLQSLDTNSPQLVSGKW